MFLGRPINVTLRLSSRDVLKMSAGCFCKRTTVFCIMLKMDVLEMFQGRLYADVTLGRN